jgi:hypothetical protein
VKELELLAETVESLGFDTRLRGLLGISIIPEMINPILPRQARTILTGTAVEIDAYGHRVYLGANSISSYYTGNR